MSQIIVNKRYLDEVKEIIMSINAFFSSGYQTKNFPLETIDSNPLRPILHWLNLVDPLFIKEPERLDDIITQIQEYAEDKTGEQLQGDDTFNQMCDKVIAMKILQLCTDNFKELNKIVNGIYDFSLFLKPSIFKDELSIFVPSILIDDIIGVDMTSKNEDENDAMFGISPFSTDTYVTTILEDDRIQFPEELSNVDEQKTRISDSEDLEGVEIVVDETVQESDVPSTFSENIVSMSKKMNHIRYENGKFKVSNEFKKNISFLIDGLEKCETSEDLLELFKTPTSEGFPKLSPDDFIPFIPAILLRVFNNTRKYPFDGHDMDTCSTILSIYNRKMEGNKGARRFGRFDLFSCFKIDKAGTIKFLRDYLEMNFINNSGKITINNNTLLTIFNIFDSNLYLSLAYEKIPNADRKGEWDSLSSFIKSIRTKINKNSRTANIYKDKEPTLFPAKTADTPTDDVEDFVEEGTFGDFRKSCLECLGEMSIADMQNCDIFEYLLEYEIGSFNNEAYNQGWGDLKTEAYIAESFNVMEMIDTAIIQEQETGALPDYMKKRMGLSDDVDSAGGGNPQLPMNPIDDLADSIGTKLGAEGDLSDQLGKGFKDNPNKGDGKVVNNITNITIRDSHIGDKKSISNVNDLSSKNDLSTGKVTTTTTTKTNSDNNSSDNSRKENTDRSTHTKNDLSSVSTNTNTNSYNSKTENPDNNNNNSGKPGESKDFNEMDLSFLIGSKKLTMEQVLTILESDEPPSTGHSAGKQPKRDLLTAAMDMDKNTLATQQGAKRKVQKGVNTVRAVTKPVTRTKSWLTKIVNSLIKRDEDKVKAEIIENPSYRTALFKASRLGLKFGMLSVCYAITPYLGAAYLIAQGAKAADKARMKREIQEEFAAELKILDDKIERASRDDTPQSRQAVWKMMRLRSKMTKVVTSKQVHKTPFTPI